MTSDQKQSHPWNTGHREVEQEQSQIVKGSSHEYIGHRHLLELNRSEPAHLSRALMTVNSFTTRGRECNGMDDLREVGYAKHLAEGKVADVRRNLNWLRFLIESASKRQTIVLQVICYLLITVAKLQRPLVLDLVFY